MAFLGWVAGAVFAEPKVAPEQQAPAANTSARAPRLPLEDTPAFALYERDIQPLLIREVAGDSCVSCHDPDGNSQLVLDGTASNDFMELLTGGYLFTEGPDTLVARINTKDPKMVMPKGKHAVPWTDEEKGKLTAFLESLNEVVRIKGRADELFPSALRTPFTGSVPEDLDNQFITYRQLRGKIQTIFQDDWVRRGEDLFLKNVALFGGADFKTRFNESSKASASFLSGLEMLSRDVADRAFTLKTGPFANRPDPMPRVDGQTKPDAAFKKEVTRLYSSVLYRAPTETEMQRTFELFRKVAESKQEIISSDFDLAFELTVEDPATGLSALRMITIPVSGEFLGLYQELVDQSLADSKERVMRHTLGRKFQFKKGDIDQRFHINNVGTFGNVSLQGIELRKTGAEKGQTLLMTDNAVQADGAWKVSTDGGVTSFEDGNIEKGTSHITLPIAVSETGDYELTVLWRRSSSNARDVLVEVFSQGGNTLAVAAPPVPPAKGEARFDYDSSADDIPYVELPGSFRFGPQDAVEINNTETRERVTASALRFVPQTSGEAFLVDTPEAEGFAKWQRFDSGRFKAYNKVGTGVHDDGKKKGELFLRYMPSVKLSAGWKETEFYRLQVNFPGKSGNEQRVPLIVHAQASSPIIQVVHPARARAESEVIIDASGTYTVQGSALKYHWKQIDGPPVQLANAGPVLKFAAPRRSVEQATWTALCRALMRHPDFLFTRPPSLPLARNGMEKKRLQLVKLALDLTGRPPTQAELADLAAGTTLEQMVDRYLATQEFKDFYFHRIRLYLESQGTESQDEPARLWCYIAHNDLPMQQILTADYTVDANFKQQARPAYHGRTGVLTTKGFIDGKPGLPHFNYAAQVAMLFLGYVFEVPPEVVEQREGSTAASTVAKDSLCYSCHKVLTPLAMQRNFWSDEGRFRTHDEYGLPIEASDAQLVEGYPFAGEGLEAFATQAVKKERFIRTIIDTHVTFFFGRQMRWKDDERQLYQRVWDNLRKDNHTIHSLIRTLLTSKEYLEGRAPVRKAETAAVAPSVNPLPLTRSHP